MQGFVVVISLFWHGEHLTHKYSSSILFLDSQIDQSSDLKPRSCIGIESQRDIDYWAGADSIFYNQNAWVESLEWDWWCH